MSSFDELKERLKGDLERTQSRLEENSTFVNLRDRFYSLNPVAQKGVIGGIALVLLLILLSVPYGSYENSNEAMTQFDERRSLLRDLYQVQKQIAETPQILAPPSLNDFKSQAEASLQNAGLLPEQLKGVSVLPAINNEVAKNTQNDGVVEVSLGQLNLKQVVDIGTQLQGINSSIKLKDLVMNASSKDPRYFDVIYRMLVLKVTQEVQAPVEAPKKKGKR